MKSEAHVDALLPDALVGQYLLAKLGGTHFMVRVLSCDTEAMRITFPGSDNPLEDTWLHLEFHDDEGVTAFRSRVLEGAREHGAGLLVEYPLICKRRLHREAFRVPTDIMAQVRDQARARRYSAEVLNLSSGGALLQMDAPRSEDSIVAMHLNFPRERNCNLTGEVVHTRWRHSSPLTVKGLFGVRFVDPDPPMRATLSHYVGERLRHLASVD